MRFDSYHPAINFIFFAAAITCTIWFDHPVFLAISYVAAFLYSVKLNGKRGLIFDLVLIPLMVLYVLWYSYYTHFGVTVLGQNFFGNDMTLESIVYGFVIAVTVAAVIMWMSCFFAVVSSDKVVYMFGRISPKLSLFLSILLRSVPRIKQTARRIEISQEGVGKGYRQGNIGRRFLNLVRLISILITWTLENFIESTQSMKSRGYSLRGRTAFSIYRFDNRDRSFVVILFLCLTLMTMAILLDQVTILYDPEIIFNRITPVSGVFYAAYAALLLLPMGLQIAGERAFERTRKTVQE
ncbi:MAG: energy-coupling factor transporter transmembrane protein EcfT [Firmicutes bacterium]|nr:energy-coupling factor transporter transmembrane protein EcfT [Bacillota bacterium]